MNKRWVFTIAVMISIIAVFTFVNASAKTYGDLDYYIYDNEVVISDCNIDAIEVVIPETIENLPVTSIGNNAFCNCSSLISIEIPDSVISIGDYAFEYCTSLISIEIPDSVTSIGNYTFSDCTSLISIEIPDSVTSIGDCAFYNCSSLISIEIPDSVTSIGWYAFGYCGNLENVYISSIESWCNIEFESYESNPMAYAENIYLNDELVEHLVIPDGITTLKNYVFHNWKSVISVENLDSVTTIGNYAFYNCSSLISIEIPDSVTSIGNYAFRDCTSLISIEIPDSVTSIGGGAFNYCTSLISIEIPDGVTSIGNYAFEYCTSLISIEIPDSVTSIGNYAFRDCTSLISIEIPDGVTSIGNYAFSDCTSLISIEIPDSVTSIGGYAFNDCTSLISIEIPDSVTSIGAYTFDDCSSLISIEIPNSVTSIGGYAFRYCGNLENVYISSIESWCNIEFESYTSNPMAYAENIYLNGELVEHLVIPEGITTLKDYAFYDCECIVSVKIPDSVTKIDKYAFERCTDLVIVDIPDSIIQIDESTFYDCYSLKSVCIPKSVKYIKNDAFNGCESIETVFYQGNQTEWNKIIKYSRNENLTNAEIVLDAQKRNYSFETNCDVKLCDINSYAVFVAPVVKNGDMSFAGWYDNAELKGNPVQFPYYGDSSTLYASWTDRTGLSFDDAFVAKANCRYAVTHSASGQLIYYEFTPKYSGEYRFYTKGNADTHGYLYDSEGNRISSNDYGSSGYNFYISRNLEAGEKYYIASKTYDELQYTLVIETDCVEGTKTVCVTGSDGEKILVTIPNYLPENAKIILACYRNGVFTEVKSTDNQNETIYFVTDKEFDFAKVMVWESFENIKPVCVAEKVFQS